MRKSLLVVVLYLLSAVVSAGSPFVKSVSELISDSDSTGDSSYFARASVRCTSLLTLFSGIMSRDSPQDDFSNLDEASKNLYTLAVLLELSKAESRGAKQDVGFAEERIGAELKNVSKLYTEWLSDNYARGGNYIESFPETREEFTQCINLGSQANKLVGS